MGKICYIEKRFAKRNLELIDSVNEIISEYKESKLRPTTAIIFASLIKRDILQKNKKDYKRLVSTIGNAREAGLISWDDIDGRKQKHKGDRVL